MGFLMEAPMADCDSNDMRGSMSKNIGGWRVSTRRRVDVTLAFSPFLSGRCVW